MIINLQDKPISLFRKKVFDEFSLEENLIRTIDAWMRPFLNHPTKPKDVLEIACKHGRFHFF